MPRRLIQGAAGWNLQFGPPGTGLPGWGGRGSLGARDLQLVTIGISRVAEFLFEGTTDVNLRECSVRGDGFAEVNNIGNILTEQEQFSFASINSIDFNNSSLGHVRADVAVPTWYAFELWFKDNFTEHGVTERIMVGQNNNPSNNIGANNPFTVKYNFPSHVNTFNGVIQWISEVELGGFPLGNGGEGKVRCLFTFNDTGNINNYVVCIDGMPVAIGTNGGTTAVLSSVPAYNGQNGEVNGFRGALGSATYWDNSANLTLADVRNLFETSSLNINADMLTVPRWYRYDSENVTVDQPRDRQVLLGAVADATGVRSGAVQRLADNGDRRNVYFELEIMDQGDDAPVGLENGGIEDVQLTASTQFDAQRTPHNARLNNPNGDHWSPSASSTAEWWKIDFGSVQRIAAISTQGGGGSANWVNTYQLEYNNDNGGSWTSYNSAENLVGNTDNSSVVTNQLIIFECRYLRVRPQTWTTFISMRIEFEFDGNSALLGMRKLAESGDVGDVSQADIDAVYIKAGNLYFGDNSKIPDGSAVGLENGVIQDSMMTASSFFDANHEARDGRLNLTGVGFAWAASTASIGEYLTIDLGAIKTIDRVAMQGSTGAAQWMLTYDLETSNDGISFTPIESAIATGLVVGNYLDIDGVIHFFDAPVTARHFRFITATWDAYPSVRLELYEQEIQDEEKLLPAITGQVYQFAIPWDEVNPYVMFIGDGEKWKGASGLDNLPVGIEDNGGTEVITDGQMTASTDFGGINLPEDGRLKNPVFTSGWRAGVNDVNQWLKIDLGAVVNVSAVATQGAAGPSFRMNTYGLDYNDDNSATWTQYNNDEILAGNVDSQSVVTHELIPFTARYVRFRPKSWNSSIAARVEIYTENSPNPATLNRGIDFLDTAFNWAAWARSNGVAGNGMVKLNAHRGAMKLPIPVGFEPWVPLETEEVAVGIEDLSIPDSAMTAFSEHNAGGFEADRGRLNLSISGWVQDTPYDVNDWIQVDLGYLRTIVEVQTQGGFVGGEHVTGYELEYSDDGIGFTSYNLNEVLTGNSTGGDDAIVSNRLIPFTARYVRLIPKTWNIGPEIRIEYIEKAETFPLESTIFGAGRRHDVRDDLQLDDRSTDSRRLFEGNSNALAAVDRSYRMPPVSLLHSAVLTFDQERLSYDSPTSIEMPRIANAFMEENYIHNANFHAYELWHQQPDFSQTIMSMYGQANNRWVYAGLQTGLNYPALRNNFNLALGWEALFDCGYGDDKPHQIFEAHTTGMTSSSTYRVYYDGVPIVADTNGGWAFPASTTRGAIEFNADGNTANTVRSGGNYGSFTAYDGGQFLTMFDVRRLYEASTYGTITAGAVGLESEAILDAQLTAESEISASFSPNHARLNNANIWAQEFPYDQDSWVQVDFLNRRTLTEVKTQGRDIDEYTTGYKLEYSLDGVNFTSYNDGEVLPANSDGSTIVTNTLIPFFCRYVRLIPWTWNTTPAIRMEFTESTVLPYDMLTVPRWLSLDAVNATPGGVDDKDVVMGAVLDNTGIRSGAIPRRDQKVYFEVFIVAQGDNIFTSNLGLRKMAEGSNVGDRAEKLGDHYYHDGGGKLMDADGVEIPTTGTLFNSSTNVTFQIAIDFATGEWWFGSGNSVWLGIGGAGNPSTGANTLPLLNLDHNWAASMNIRINGDGNSTVRLITADVDLTYTKPTGYVAWEDATA